MTLVSDMASDIVAEIPPVEMPPTETPSTETPPMETPPMETPPAEVAPAVPLDVAPATGWQLWRPSLVNGSLTWLAAIIT